MASVRFGDTSLLDFHGPASSDSSTDAFDHALDMAAGPFESAWTIDHLQSGDEKILEGYTMAAYMAGAHPGLKFGNTVLRQSFRSPALLAKMAASLQFLGRRRYPRPGCRLE